MIVITYGPFAKYRNFSSFNVQLLMTNKLFTSVDSTYICIHKIVKLNKLNTKEFKSIIIGHRPLLALIMIATETSGSVSCII